MVDKLETTFECNLRYCCLHIKLR